VYVSLASLIKLFCFPTLAYPIFLDSASHLNNISWQQLFIQNHKLTELSTNKHVLFYPLSEAFKLRFLERNSKRQTCSLLCRSCAERWRIRGTAPVCGSRTCTAQIPRRLEQKSSHCRITSCRKLHNSLASVYAILLPCKPSKLFKNEIARWLLCFPITYYQYIWFLDHNCLVYNNCPIPV
jgi:hypothetical protein